MRQLKQLSDDELRAKFFDICERRRVIDEEMRVVSDEVRRRYVEWRGKAGT